MVRVIYFSLVIVLCSISSSFSQSIDLQGHRGCRGLMPENSIPGFLKAIDLGVTTIEMDVVISADGKVVVSHDPYISSQFCYNELGKEIKKKDERNINIYQLDYEDIILFDCGSKIHDGFPDQQMLSVYKPLLSEVIQKCETYIATNDKKPIQYSIELKSRPDWDFVYHPEPRLFTELVHQVLIDLLPSERVIIQSFDLRALQIWKMKYSDYKISFLVSNPKTPSKNIEELGFEPDIYSPNYKLISKKEIAELHNKNIKVIPWTVNDEKNIKKMIDLGVDGIITDYPNRYFEIKTTNH